MLSTVAFGAITQGPENTLVVRCKDYFANMSCLSNAATPEIAWTYDGNTVINSPCLANTEVFHAVKTNRTYGESCGIASDLFAAMDDQYIGSISGPYGCTDRSNDGVTNTSMVIVLGTFCLHHIFETVLWAIKMCKFYFQDNFGNYRLIFTARCYAERGIAKASCLSISL